MIDLIAKRHRIGAYAFAGSLVREGSLRKDVDVDLVVTAPLERLCPFGDEISIALDRDVHLHSFAHLPWMHRYHVGLEWRNVTRLPVIPAPAGGIVVHNGLRIKVEQIPHFLAVKTRVEIKRGVPNRIISRPPPGVFSI